MLAQVEKETQFIMFFKQGHDFRYRPVADEAETMSTRSKNISWLTALTVILKPPESAYTLTNCISL